MEDAIKCIEALKKEINARGVKLYYERKIAGKRKEEVRKRAIEAEYMAELYAEQVVGKILNILKKTGYNE